MSDNSTINKELLSALLTDDGKHVSEAKIANLAIERYGLISFHGRLYDCDGELSRDWIVKQVAEILVALGVERGNARMAEQVFKLIIQLAAEEGIPFAQNEIPVKNGTITVNMKDGSIRFSPVKKFSPYRLACDFDPNSQEMPWFTRWLSDVLYKEDHNCFQEFMGYLLLPITYGQCACFLIGEGGCGKSVWGCILRGIFGTAMTSAETHALENDRFARATLENKLLNYDDDLDGAKMQKTNLFKILVTAKQSIQAERKGVDRFEFLPFARLCGCGNSSLASMFDLSDAFVRRLLLIKARPPIPKDKIIPDIETRIIPEVSAILNWALEGLRRLMEKKYQFSISERSKELVQAVREESNSIIPFIDDEIEFEDGYRVSSADLVIRYKTYCRTTGLVLRSDSSVIQYLKDHQEQYGVRYSNKVPGKHAATYVRGFRGMRLKPFRTDTKSAGDTNTNLLALLD